VKSPIHDTVKLTYPIIPCYLSDFASMTLIYIPYRTMEFKWNTFINDPVRLMSS
jgi:hypothetical protein